MWNGFEDVDARNGHDESEIEVEVMTRCFLPKGRLRPGSRRNPAEIRLSSFQDLDLAIFRTAGRLTDAANNLAMAAFGFG